VVNIQGDEPLIGPAAMDRRPLRWRTIPESSWHPEEENRGPARSGRSERGQGGRQPRRDAIYFSRWTDSLSPGGMPSTRHDKHIGLLVLRIPVEVCAAARVDRWNKPSAWNSCGPSRTAIPFGVVETEYESIGVDTPTTSTGVRRLFAEAPASACAEPEASG